MSTAVFIMIVSVKVGATEGWWKWRDVSVVEIGDGEDNLQT